MQHPQRNMSSSESPSEGNEYDHLDDIDADNERYEDILPIGKGRLGWFTVMCLILNRTIGSGIFATPSKTILGTGNIGPSLVMWVFGGLISLCGLNVWNEFGLTVPRRREPTSGEEKSVPRSGGEKNYVIRFSEIKLSKLADHAPSNFSLSIWSRCQSFL